MKSNIIHIVNALGLLNFSILFKGLNDVFGTDSSWISKEGNDILNNPEDKKKVENAVSELKKGNFVEPIKLSNGKTINIRID
ncbi:MAG: hypothetical protein ACTTJM_00780 [Bergeyella cardium]